MNHLRPNPTFRLLMLLGFLWLTAFPVSAQFGTPIRYRNPGPSRWYEIPLPTKDRDVLCKAAYVMSLPQGTHKVYNSDRDGFESDFDVTWIYECRGDVRRV